jgi:flagellar basal-body rod protein FlgC
MINAMSAAVSGLFAQARRLEGSASNVANFRSDGAVPDASGSVPDGAPEAYSPVRVDAVARADGGVDTRTRPDPSARTFGYAPDRPYANAGGLVQTAGVDLGMERVSQIEASIAYRANIATLKTADQMARTILDLTA